MYKHLLLFTCFSLYLRNLCLCVFTETLSYGIFVCVFLTLAVPPLLLLFCFEAKPIQAETCDYPSIEDSMELNVLKFLSLTTTPFLEAKSASQLRHPALPCQRKLLI